MGNKLFVTIALKNTMLVHKGIFINDQNLTPAQAGKQMRKEVLPTLNGEWKPRHLAYAVYEEVRKTYRGLDGSISGHSIDYQIVAKSDNFQL